MHSLKASEDNRNHHRTIRQPPHITMKTNQILALIALLFISGVTGAYADIIKLAPLDNAEPTANVTRAVTSLDDIVTLETKWRVKLTLKGPGPCLVAESEPNNQKYWVIPGPALAFGSGGTLENVFNTAFKMFCPEKRTQVIQAIAANDQVQALKYKLLIEVISESDSTKGLFQQAIEFSKDSANPAGPTKSKVLNSIAKTYGLQTAQTVAGNLVDDLEKD